MFVVNGRFLSQKIAGVHRYAFEICNELHEMGVDFYVVTPKEIHPCYKFKFKTVSCGDFSGHAWEHISLPRYLKKNGNPLLISFTGCGPLNYDNQIMTIHDVSHEMHPEWFSKNYYRYYHFMMPRIGNKAHAILTVSEFSKREIINAFGFDADKIHVVHSNVPFKNKPSAREILDREPASDAERYIITVSSIDPRKNFGRLIDAFNNIEDKSIKLYIIGTQFKNFNTPDLQQKITDRVIMPGYISDEELEKMYANALFSIYPTLYEGFGLPPLESMTYGCPVIASDIPSLREISGDAVIYTDPYDINDMTEKMNMMAIDAGLRHSLVVKGLEQIKEYSWQKSARQVYELAKRFE